MLSSIPTISRDQFVARLSKRKYEDLDLVTMIDRHVVKNAELYFVCRSPDLM